MQVHTCKFTQCSFSNPLKMIKLFQLNQYMQIMSHINQIQNIEMVIPGLMNLVIFVWSSCFRWCVLIEYVNNYLTQHMFDLLKKKSLSKVLVQDEMAYIKIHLVQHWHGNHTNRSLSLKMTSLCQLSHWWFHSCSNHNNFRVFRRSSVLHQQVDHTLGLDE